MSQHSRTPGLISLFLPMLLLPAVSDLCSQKAKHPAAIISAAASQSLPIINFIKGLGSPCPFHGPDSGEITTGVLARAQAGTRRYVRVGEHECARTCVRERERERLLDVPES